MSETLKIEYVPIESIRAYENNAKQHPQEQIEQIKESIRQFNFNDPIAVWHDEIVEGHGRLYAAQELGIKSVPIIRLDDLTDEQRRAYALVHNKLTMNSGFDYNLLDLELSDISLDMTEFGFESVDVGDMSALFTPAEEREKKDKRVQCPHCGEWFEP